MIKVIIITHGKLGNELLTTAENILGKQEEVEVLSLNTESLSNMCFQTELVLKQVDESEGAIILTDMLGGTPCNACLPFCGNYTIEIISGINLYMLLSALLNRSKMPLKNLADKVIQDGRKNIANAKEIFLQRLK